MIHIERLEAVEPSEAGTVIHYRAGGRSGSICVPPALIPALLAAIVQTDHVGVTEHTPAAVPAEAHFGIAEDQETGQPVLGVLFENKLGIAIPADEPLIAALETIVAELKKKKRH